MLQVRLAIRRISAKKSIKQLRIAERILEMLGKLLMKILAVLQVWGSKTISSITITIWKNVSTAIHLPSMRKTANTTNQFMVLLKTKRSQWQEEHTTTRRKCRATRGRTLTCKCKPRGCLGRATTTRFPGRRRDSSCRWDRRARASKSTGSWSMRTGTRLHSTPLLLARAFRQPARGNSRKITIEEHSVDEGVACWLEEWQANWREKSSN